jgi:Domain of unknown function DUF1829/Domain of unknown function DUF1828
MYNELFKDPNRIKEFYLSWLNEKITSQVSPEHDIIEIETPFLNHNNDWISIYLATDNNMLILSDSGNTLNELELSGVNLKTNARKEVLNNFLNTYGLKLKDEELYKVTSLNTIAQDKHFLIQGILAINDMFILNRTTVKSLFFEDVIKHFDSLDIRYTSDIVLIDKSGLQHNFSFVIPKSKKYNERIINAMNHLDSKDKLQGTLMKFIDLKETRRDVSGVVIINDLDKNIKNEYITALHNYDIKTILFSKISEYNDFLIH